MSERAAYPRDAVVSGPSAAAATINVHTRSEAGNVCALVDRLDVAITGIWADDTPLWAREVAARGAPSGPC